jgi:ATP synthase F1 gamma subunit
VRDRIGSVKNTQKITEAMKLVAAAKVRRAQEAVVNGRPFAENLVKVGLETYSCNVSNLEDGRSSELIDQHSLTDIEIRSIVNYLRAL